MNKYVNEGVDGVNVGPVGELGLLGLHVAMVIVVMVEHARHCSRLVIVLLLKSHQAFRFCNVGTRG